MSASRQPASTSVTGTSWRACRTCYGWWASDSAHPRSGYEALIFLFSYELARRLSGTSVTANALHPGMVSTSFGAEDPARIQKVLVPLLRHFMKTPARGAATSVHLSFRSRS